VSVDSVASNVMTSLGNGSGIDITKLARDLADVEKAPKEERITKSKEAAEAKISAIAVLKYNVTQLVAQFNGLNDAVELATPSAASSDTTKVSITSTDGSAASGSSDLNVTALAAAQRNRSDSLSSTTQSLNSGSAFTLTVTPGTGSATTVSIAAGNDTPAGVVAAINAAGAGYRASLVATDASASSYRIMLEGPTGASNSFSVASTPDLGFHDTSNNGGATNTQNAANAALTYNGLAITRSSNTLNDVIDGVTLNLKDTGSTTVNVTSDRATLKTKLQNLVTVYNDLQFALNELSDPESEEEDVGGALARDLSVIRTVRDSVYKSVSQNSSTPSGNITALRDIGVNLTRDGKLSFDEATYDSKASTNFDDISTMLSAGTTNQSRYDGLSQGLAMDGVIELEKLTDSITGVFATRTATAQKQITEYENDLADLEKRIESIYARYLDQFIAMETLVNSIKGTRESMTTTWENMGNFNKK